MKSTSHNSDRDAALFDPHKIDERFNADPHSGIYLPKWYASARNSDHPPPAPDPQDVPLWIENAPDPLREWASVGISFVGVVISGATLLLLFYTVFYASLQWREMTRTTRASIEAARAATRSVRLYEETLSAQTKEAHLSERAWVGISQPTTGPNKQGQLELLPGSVMNTGKTPARNAIIVEGYYRLFGNVFVPGPKDFAGIQYILKMEWANQITGVTCLSCYMKPKWHAELTPPTRNYRDTIAVPIKTSLGVIPPGSLPYRFSLPVSDLPNMFATVLYGEFRYIDMFDAKHSTRFCFYQPSDKTEYIACDGANEMN